MAFFPIRYSPAYIMINAFAKKIFFVLFLNNIIVLTVFSEHPVYICN